jgi:hypothetical protein
MALGAVRRVQSRGRKLTRGLTTAVVVPVTALAVTLAADAVAAERVAD